MKSTNLTFSILVSVGLLLLAGCQIEEIEEGPVGHIAVSAFDTTRVTPVELLGGTIYLDGSLRSETAPDTLDGIPTGMHTVEVKVTGYELQSKQVEVYESEVAPASFNLIPAAVGLLEVTSEPSSALIIIDLEFSGATTPHQFDNIEVGHRDVTVFLDGYRTISPALMTATVIDLENPVSASFTLEPGTVGNQEGNIAIDFTLDDDFGNVISLHNYRGRVVLLSFFFKDCVACILEFPEIEAAFQDYQQHGFQVLGIDPMFFDEIEDVQEVRNDLGLTFNLLLDWQSIYANQNEVGLYPTNIIVDQSGEIAVRMLNVTYEQLADILNDLLGL